jgi:hypothetical protein
VYFNTENQNKQAIFLWNYTFYILRLKLGKTWKSIRNLEDFSKCDSEKLGNRRKEPEKSSGRNGQGEKSVFSGKKPFRLPENVI